MRAISLHVLRKSLIWFMIIHFLGKMIYCILTRRRQLAGLKGIPGLGRSNWLLGYAPYLSQNMMKYQDWIYEVVKDRKLTLMTLPIFAPTVFLYTQDPAIVKHVLKDRFDVYLKPNPEKNGLFSYLRYWIGDGIFIMNHGPHSDDQGQLWHQSRKTASTIFTRDNFRDLMRNTFVRKAKVLLDVLEKNGEGNKIDMQLKMFAFTMDSIMAMFFGKETNNISGSHDLYAEYFDDAHRSMMKFVFANFGGLALLDFLPWPLGSFKMKSGGNLHVLFCLLHPEGRNFLNSVHKLRDLSIKICKDKMNDPDLKNQRDLLALFMNAQDENGQSYAQTKHLKFLCDTTLSLVIAGRDTTACTLSWLFYTLSVNPDIQEKLCKEIDEKLKGEEPTDDNTSANHMPYLNGVVYEILRLYPPVHEDIKVAVTDDVLPDGTKIAKGTSIIYHPYGMGRDSQRYPDPLKVQPERWIPFTKPSDFEFPVFQAGPRICLGMRMAILEIKVLVSMLLQKYTFTLLEGEKDKIRPSLMITMSVCNSPNQDSFNLWLIPHSRQKKENK